MRHNYYRSKFSHIRIQQLSWNIDLFKETPAPKGGGGGWGEYSVQETPQGRSAKMGSKSASWYVNDPYKIKNLVYVWVNFSKFSQIWLKI